jgi:predicted dehydrogenase
VDPIRVGIVGQGRSGRDIHGVYLATDARYRIVAVADALADRRARAAREYGCATHADVAGLLARKDLDLVVNSSFSFQHVPVTLAALEAGHHVLCEKPFASTVQGVDRMVAAAKRAGKVLAVFQQSRYAPYFTEIRRVIASGVLGRIVQVSIAFNGFGRRWDWQTLREFDGGNLLNTGPHPLDQALTLFGAGDPEVWCRMDRTVEGWWGDAENHVKLILSGKNHPTIDIEISSCCAYAPTLYRVYGTLGGLQATADSVEWRWFDPAAAPSQHLIREPLCKEDGTPAYCGEKLPWQTAKWPEAQPATGGAGGYTPSAPGTVMSASLYSMLYRTLREGAPLEITPEQVRRQIAVIEVCQRQNPHIYGPKG